MCISCGCDEPDANHGNPKHITLSQFKQAAQAAEVDMDQLLRNIKGGAGALRWRERGPLASTRNKE